MSFYLNYKCTIRYLLNQSPIFYKFNFEVEEDAIIMWIIQKLIEQLLEGIGSHHLLHHHLGRASHLPILRKVTNIYRYRYTDMQIYGGYIKKGGDLSLSVRTVMGIQQIKRRMSTQVALYPQPKRVVAFWQESS